MKRLSENWSVEPGSRDPALLLSDGAGLVSMCLGLAVMAGWIGGWPRVVQIAPGFVPMYFNTALCFFLFGAGLFLCRRGRGRTVGMLCASLAGLIALCIGLEYIFNADFGIDRVFIHPGDMNGFPYPGRTAPNNCFCFCLFSGTLLILHFFRRGWERLTLLLLPCTIAFLLSANTLLGYVFQTKSAYGWWGGSLIAPHTELGLLAGAIGLFALVRATHRELPLGPLWIPALAGGAGIALTMIVDQAILLHMGDNRQGGILAIMALIAGSGLSILLAHALWQNGRLAQITSDLRISRERYAFALASANMAAWDWDPVRDAIVWSGEPWRIIGVDKDSPILANQHFIRELVSPEEYAAMRASLDKALMADHGFSLEFRIKRPDGHDMWALSTGRAITFEDGKATRVTGTLMDITARRHAEDELKRSNHELEQFAYVASHDLKAPLRNIDNLAQWVIEDMGEAMPADIAEKMNLLRGRVARLETLLDDILAYSRAGRIVEKAAVIDTGELVRRIAHTHAPEGFEVRIEGTMPEIVSPRTPLEQIFGNLIGNAVKHHDRDRGLIEIRAAPKDDFIEFSVTDDGPGIPEAYRERVFEMFQTLQSRDRVPGSGLGMSIVRKLVEWQGGRAWIEGNPAGRGTSVHFLWPPIKTD